MKKIFSIILCLILGHANIIAQVDTICNNIYGFNGNMGIGISMPLSDLHIKSYEPVIRMNTTLIKHIESAGKGRLEFHGDMNDFGHLMTTSLDRFGDDTEDLIVQLFQTNLPSNAYGILESWHGAGLVISASGDGDLNPLIFAMNRNEVARFNPWGYLGLGTEDPVAKLHVANGDIYIGDIDYGIIMKSPDGQCWRGTINDFGSLIFQPIVCPDLTVSVPESSPVISNLNIYPNPSESEINVEIPSGLFSRKMELKIFDESGRYILTDKVSSQRMIINVGQLPAGFYEVSLIDRKGNKVASGKMLVK